MCSYHYVYFLYFLVFVYIFGTYLDHFALLLSGVACRFSGQTEPVERIE